MEAVLPIRRRSYGSIRSPVVKRNSQSMVVLQGWLLKLEGAALKQWKHRWCVLSDFCLFFYKTPNEEKVYSTVLLPSYTISPCVSDDHISRKFSFKAEHQNMKTYFFAADGMESMKKWMNAMSLASIMQNYGRMESDINSTTCNDEEDSGFTSYRSRRYGENDPGLTFDGSFGSEGLKQRSLSCGERVGEAYLRSDEKYPPVLNNPQYLHMSPASQPTVRHRQPLYANAPPKPKRLTQHDPYAILPNEQYNSSYFPDQGITQYQYQTPEMYMLHDPYMKYENENVYMNEISHQQMYRNPQLHGNHYGPQVQERFERPERPHSADFLERDMEYSNAMQVPRNQSGEIRAQRPKSSLEYYDRYDDQYEYDMEDYRHAVRMQADHLYTNKSQSQRSMHTHDHTNDVKSADTMYSDQYAPPSVQYENQISTYHDHSRDKGLGLPKPIYDPAVDISQMPYKKITTHKESMQRLMEWKQRMLQSPLSRRNVPYSSSSSDASSPRRHPNRPPLPSQCQMQNSQELNLHDPHPRKHDMLHKSQLEYGDNICNGDYISKKTRHKANLSRSANQELFQVDYSNPVGNLRYLEDNISVCRPMPSFEEASPRVDASSTNEQTEIMYCVDSENNEILIYDDDGVSEVLKERPHLANDKRYKQQNETSVKDVSSKDCSPVQHHNLDAYSAGVKLQQCHISPDKLTSSSRQRYESCSEDDEKVYCRPKRGTSRSKSAFSRMRNVSDSEIHIHEKTSPLRKVMQFSEGVMNKGKRLSISAGDLLGKTHEELVLLLIQLRRNQSRVIRAKDKCCQQIKNMEQLSEIDENMQEVYAQNFGDLMQQVSLLEKQYESTRPLVNLVDNMVKLGSLYGNSDNKAHPQLPVADLNLSQEHVLFPRPQLLQTATSEDHELQGHLNEIYSLDHGLSRETHSFTSLQQDKEMLESTLDGMRIKILDFQDKPIELQKLKKQQRLIEKELARVKRLLSHSAKKIEDASSKNDQLEQEILSLRWKLQQALNTGSYEMKTAHSRADLEAELTRVQNVLEELANHRQEISNTVETLKSDAHARLACSSKVRASPTGVAGSAPLPLRKKQQSTYLETDLDTMETYDLSNVCRDSDDIPVYANAEEIINPTVEVSENEVLSNVENSNINCTSDQGVSQCPLQDISDADDKMKRFYGILPREKPCEIKTVRIVKRQSERRSRERDKRRTYGDQSSSWADEPDFSSDDLLETDDETFKRGGPPSYSRPTSLLSPQITMEKQSGSAHDRLFGNVATSKEETESVPEKIPNKGKALKRTKRRHYTVSGYQNLSDPQFAEFFRDRPRSRDDVDMERCLRTANTPDIVKSTIKKKEVFDDQIIDRELGLPDKISIPERYVENEPETLSASEKLRRSLKAENIRKMLSQTTANYENVAETSLAAPDTVHEKCSEQKRKRAHLLALNHALAQEVMERSKAVAVLATLETFICRKKQSPSEELSPMVELPITQQRYNLLC